MTLEGRSLTAIEDLKEETNDHSQPAPSLSSESGCNWRVEELKNTLGLCHSDF